jgi:hypothetical protein
MSFIFQVGFPGIRQPYDNSKNSTPTRYSKDSRTFNFEESGITTGAPRKGTLGSKRDAVPVCYGHRPQTRLLAAGMEVIDEWPTAKSSTPKQNIGSYHTTVMNPTTRSWPFISFHHSPPHGRSAPHSTSCRASKCGTSSSQGKPSPNHRPFAPPAWPKANASDRVSPFSMLAILLTRLQLAELPGSFSMFQHILCEQFAHNVGPSVFQASLGSSPGFRRCHLRRRR